MTLIHLLFSFKGRISRNTYWLVMPVLFLFWYMVVAIPVSDAGANAELGKFIAFLVWVPLSTYIWCAVCVKRLHDMGRKGWVWLVALVPIATIPFAVWLAVAKSVHAGNEYGPQPEMW